MSRETSQPPPASPDAAPATEERRRAKAKEVELARQLLDGRAEAFDPFVRLVQSRVFQYALLMCGQRDDAEEVAQDTLLKAFENFAQLRDPEKVRAWIFQIARNACYMKRRKSIFAPDEEVSLETVLRSDDGGLRFEIADWSKLPEQQTLAAEMRALLEDAIRSLPPNYRSVVLMRDVEQLSVAETAQVLGLSTDVVKTRLHRARLAIRQRLDEALRARVPL